VKPLLKVSLVNNPNNATKGNLVKSLNGTISLDSIIDDIIFDVDKEAEHTKRKKQMFRESIDALSQKYLTDSERLVYNLYVEGKTVADIERIMGFGCWYTSEKHIIKVFKILGIYYRYHCLNPEELQTILKSKFTPYQRNILSCLHDRKTFNETTKEMGGYYRKIYYDCMEIFEILESSGKVGKGYSKFLKDIRKFKRGK
jgi:hypothetical protein